MSLLVNSVRISRKARLGGTAVSLGGASGWGCRLKRTPSLQEKAARGEQLREGRAGHRGGPPVHGSHRLSVLDLVETEGEGEAAS